MKSLINKSGNYLVILFSLIPIFLWLPYASFSNLTSILKSIGQITALVGSILFCISFILSARWRFIEEFFFGLNRVFIVHHLVGAISFTLLLLHPLFIILSYLFISFESAISLLTPSLSNWALGLGSVALIILTILLILTLYLRLEYDTWKITHQYLGIPLLFALFHVFFIGSTIDQSQLLKFYVFGFFLFALISFFYRLITKNTRVFKFEYKIVSVKVENSIVSLELKPLTKKLKFEPGQFVFIKFKHLGIPKQSHPFSITSAPSNPNLTLSIKSVGDFTETLKLLESGVNASIEGPYGRFSYKYIKNSKQLWIAAGIGVTPFMSMLNSITPNDLNSIIFVYCQRDKNEGISFDYLKQINANKQNIRLINWVSKENGRLTAKDLFSDIKDLKERDILICGPLAMMTDLKIQLKQIEVRPQKIHTEEFSLS
jgi:predicted ferric reductase